MKRSGGRILVICLVIAGLCLSTGGNRPAQANGDTNLAIGATVLGVIAVPVLAYAVYRNLPSHQEQPKFPGEFYVAAYLGASLVPSQDLKYENGAILLGGASISPFTTGANKFQPGVVGGLKLGYFWDKIPYLGVEFETNFNPNRVRRQAVSLSPAVVGSSQGILPDDNWVAWTMAAHIVGRYGFLPDQEVPFGRLQPYLGIGPGFVVLYDEHDAAKNFAIDVMAGLRYMMLKNVSAFVEYKYSHQFDVEMETHDILVPAGVIRGTAHLPYDSHKIVAGFAYHF
jgi:opacity protein-like surface antigen